MKTSALVLALVAACGSSHDVPPVTGDATVRPPDAAPPPVVAIVPGEQCGNDLDDDGDGLADEDCPPSRFAGVFAPMVSVDPAIAAIEGVIHRPLSVIQTYHSTSAAGIAAIAPDLQKILSSGHTAHLNIEPSGYTPAQYAAPDTEPLESDLAAMAHAVVAGIATSQRGILLTFGAEMNGSWTDWGCLPAAQYIALYRAAHAAVDAALAAQQVDPRRIRWAFGPNATSSASCGTPAGYYPGADVVDYLGMSAYRMDGTTVAQSVTDPMNALYAATGAKQRFIVLQTGARVAADRDAWIQQLYAVDDPRIAGIIWFDAADWAAPATSLAPIATLPVADGFLAGVFEPYFTDVPYGATGYNEIQLLVSSFVTTGCGKGTFCPDALLTRRQAAVFLVRANGTGSRDAATFSDVPPDDPALAEIETAIRWGLMTGCAPTKFCPDDPILEADFETAILTFGLPWPTQDAMTTRARAAILLARGLPPGVPI